MRAFGYIRNAALMLTAILGSNFGARDPREDLIERQIGGVHNYRGGKTGNGRTKRPFRQRQRARSGHSQQRHRRSYLSGKPGLRHV